VIRVPTVQSQRVCDSGNGIARTNFQGADSVFAEQLWGACCVVEQLVSPPDGGPGSGRLLPAAPNSRLQSPKGAGSAYGGVRMADQDWYIELLWSSKALVLRQEAFELKSGRLSYSYANHRNLVLDPDVASTCVDLITAVARHQFGSSFAIATVRR
jgi:hypothetical protein